MKLVAESENQLVFLSYPWTRWIAALVLVAMGLGILLGLRPNFDTEPVLLDLVAGGAILLGLLVAALVPIVTAEFDVPAGALSLRKKTLFGKSSKRFPFGQIAEVEAHRYHLKHSVGFRVRLLLKDGKTLAIGSDMYSLPARAEEEAEKIRALMDRYTRLAARRQSARTSVAAG